MTFLLWRGPSSSSSTEEPSPHHPHHQEGRAGFLLPRRGQMILLITVSVSDTAVLDGHFPPKFEKRRYASGRITDNLLML